MVFIPCKDGISHSGKESVEPEDVAAAAQVVTDVPLALTQLSDPALKAPAITELFD